MSRSRLLIVGASARAAAFSACRAGLEPVAFDCFSDLDLVARCPTILVKNYPQGLTRHFANRSPTPWMYTGGLENYPQLVRKLAEKHRLLGNDEAVLTQIRDPFRVYEVLNDAGFAMPRVRPSRDRPKRGKWLVKPLRSSGGIGISTWSGEQVTPGSDYLQQFIAGPSHSAVYVASPESCCLVGVTRQLIGDERFGATGFRYVGSIGPVAVSEAIANELCELGERLVEEFRLRGVFGVDFVIHKARAWPIEINPRYTASCEILERATNASIVHAHYEACHWKKSVKIKCEATDCRFGKAILYSTKPTTLSERFTSWALGRNRDREWPLLADIPHPGTVIEAEHPILTVFADGKTEPAAYRGLVRAAVQLFEQFY